MNARIMVIKIHALKISDKNIVIGMIIIVNVVKQRLVINYQLN